MQPVVEEDKSCSDEEEDVWYPQTWTGDGRICAPPAVQSVFRSFFESERAGRLLEREAANAGADDLYILPLK